MTELTDAVVQAVDRATGDELLEAYSIHRVATSIDVGTGIEIRHVGHADTQGLGVRIIAGGRLGYASTSDLSENSISVTVERARANAAVSDVDDAQTLPSPAKAPPGPEFLDRGLSQVPLTAKITLAEELARRTVAIDPRVTAIDAVEYHDEIRRVAIASTLGVNATYESGHVALWSDALGEDGDARSNDWAYDLRRTPSDLDPGEIARRAVRRTVSQLGPELPAPPGLPVILDPHVVADLLEAIGKGLSGGPVSSGRTPFADHWGKQVASDVVTLVDDGLALRSTLSARYDDEGVPRRTATLMSNGVLTNAMHSSVTARAAGAAGSTGNARRASHRSSPRAAPTALALAPTMSTTELFDGLSEAIYLHRLTGAGVGVSPVTGRIDVGAAASLWRDGEFVGRVGVLPLATDLVSLLRTITHVADDTQPQAFSFAQGTTILSDASLLHPHP